MLLSEHFNFVSLSLSKSVFAVGILLLTFLRNFHHISLRHSNLMAAGGKRGRGPNVAYYGRMPSKPRLQKMNSSIKATEERERGGRRGRELTKRPLGHRAGPLSLLEN